MIVEFPQHRAQVAVRPWLVESARHIAQVREQAREHVGVGPQPREALDRAARDLAEGIVGLVSARDADELEVLGQRALVGEVVERREQLAVRQIAGGAEDDDCRGIDRQALETFGQRIVRRDVVERRGAHPPAAGAASRTLTLAVVVIP
jgi:hypothetical protein